MQPAMEAKATNAPTCAGDVSNDGRKVKEIYRAMEARNSNGVTARQVVVREGKRGRAPEEPDLVEE